MHLIAFAASEHHIPRLSKKCLSGESGSLRLSKVHPSRAHVLAADRNGGVWGGTDMAFAMTHEALNKLLPEQHERLVEVRTQDARISLDRDGRMLVAKSPDIVSTDISGLVIYRESFDARCMMALMEVLDGLPLITVLQAVILDARDHDTVWLKTGEGGSISGEEFFCDYPYGILLRPKQRVVLPRFVSTATGKLLHGPMTAP